MPTRAQESRAAIERLYIAMRHLFIRGYYKPFGVSGSALRSALLTLRPEIYGSIDDPEKVELDGLAYIFDRLPRGIEECRYIKLISEEGYVESGFERLVPPARRRNCFRIDQEQMFIEVTRGRSEIYDILTHLTFMCIEAEKIKNNALTDKGTPKREWEKIEEIVLNNVILTNKSREIAFTYLSSLLGRTFEETKACFDRFASSPNNNNGLFHIVYWLGRRAMEEQLEGKAREISFSPVLRERIGQHIYGERWAEAIKEYLYTSGLFERPLHIISANMHSVMNSLFGRAALKGHEVPANLYELALELSKPENGHMREQVSLFAEQFGMYTLYDTTGTHIPVQIIDTSRLDPAMFPKELQVSPEVLQTEKPVLLVMDYAFGEQAYETMDELLKPFHLPNGKEVAMNVVSVSIMGKAGILLGEKGDIMIPTAHVFEGTADNYPFYNQFNKADFEGHGVEVFEGPMITVLGTSLQNRDILSYFKNATWNAVGLEMEGAHYQKAIQSASRIRGSVRKDVEVRYAYYASDNPLITGSTLASGSLGLIGVKPTYLITVKILAQIMGGVHRRSQEGVSAHGS